MKQLLAPVIVLALTGCGFFHKEEASSQRSDAAAAAPAAPPVKGLFATDASGAPKCSCDAGCNPVSSGARKHDKAPPTSRDDGATRNKLGEPSGDGCPVCPSGE